MTMETPIFTTHLDVVFLRKSHRHLAPAQAAERRQLRPARPRLPVG